MGLTTSAKTLSKWQAILRIQPPVKPLIQVVSGATPKMRVPTIENNGWNMAISAPSNSEQNKVFIPHLLRKIRHNSNAALLDESSIAQ